MNDPILDRDRTARLDHIICMIADALDWRRRGKDACAEGDQKTWVFAANECDRLLAEARAALDAIKDRDEEWGRLDGVIKELQGETE